ncbi:MAG: Recombination protein RarA [Thermoanaerobacterales bacterium 50_218]|nr:MAG: Recombination protein RarA [Thermoanaerobacterales bacterium 50_218]HAA89648.1 AAA family ATPase [Peptococcaceae bacterium]
MRRKAPLAYRLRPRSLEEFVGQEHLTAPGRIIYQAVTEDKFLPAIFYGPPGTGKTSLAGIIARMTKSRFIQVDASNTGVGEIRKVLQEAQDTLRFFGKQTILFIDEIHRFNKAQQDILLPAVEQGVIILIGATTENPFFEINAPLLSRTRVLPFYPLEEKHLHRILDIALSDRERGLGKLQVEVTPEAREFLVRSAGGDARVLLNSLEASLDLGKRDPGGVLCIDQEAVAAAIQKKIVLYDRDGDQHYDVLSAFIKSMRGSDPDAALHWLARMLQAGEDPRLIARRIIICAAEDVGLADPQALVVATAAAQGVDYVGMPEAQLLLAEAVLYIACAPKSNRAYVALKKALDDLEKENPGTVPNHLRDSSYPGAKVLGRGRGYLYPHDYPEGYVPQQYLPDLLKGRRYYQPSDRGHERKIKEYLKQLRGVNFDA